MHPEPPIQQSPVLVCFAVPEEASTFRQQQSLLVGVEVLITGMGRRNAERALEARLKRGRPRMVFTCGFAGGLDPVLRPGALLCDADDGFPLALALGAAGARRGVFLCAEHIAITPTEKQALRERSGADAVEMESGWIRAICSEERLPSATLRVITDTADEALPLDFNRLLDTDQRLRWNRFVLAVLGRPSSIAGLWGLHRRSRAGAELLSRALVRVISPESRAGATQVERGT